MGYGAYNSVMYNLTAFNAGRSAALGSTRTGDSAVTQAAHVLIAASTVAAVPTCGRINMGYGAYNSVVYDRSAFNSDWPEALRFARTGDSAASSDDHVLVGAGTWFFRVRPHPRGGKVTVH